MAFLRNHQMFLQVFSKKVRFCCILWCFAEKKLPQMSQILTDGACLEFCEFCVLWEYSSPTDCTDQHIWLVALVVAWVWQGCHTLLHLCKSVLSVGDPSLQEGSVNSVGELFWLRGVYPPTEQTGRRCSPTDFTDSHRWLVALVVAWVRQDAIPSYICVNPCYLWETLLYKKVLRRSVKSVGEYHSEKVL